GGLPVEGGLVARLRGATRAARRLGGGGGGVGPGPGGRVVVLPHGAQAGRAPGAAAAARVGNAARGSGAAGRALRRLLPDPVPPPRTRGAAEAPVLEEKRQYATRTSRVQTANAQPRDLPGLHQHSAPRSHVHGVRAAEVPRPAPREGVHAGDPPVAG